MLGRKLSLELLEDRTLLSPVLTVTNLTVNGSNGAFVRNGGNWFDDPGTTLSLTASTGNVTRNTDGTWNWSSTGPALSQAVTITGDDGSAYKAFTTFYLNSTVRTVSNTNDSGTGSLRQAIMDTNNDKTDVDEIVFAITGTGPFTIQPRIPLDPISTPVFIKGTTETGWAKNTSDTQYNANLPVVLDGTAAGASEGLLIAGGNSTVEGLQIQNFANGGIHLLTHGNDSILGNNITNAGVGYASPNAFLFGGGGGVYIDGVAGNIIGGTTLDARNKFWDDRVSVQIAGAGASNNQVLGNVIGTDGTAEQPSYSYTGVLIDGASDNTIGGTAPGSKNVITGGPGGGNSIQIWGGGYPNFPSSASSGNAIQGNYIDTDSTGSQPLPSAAFAIGLDGSDVSNTLIGGPSASARNVIGGGLPGFGGAIGINGSYSGPYVPQISGTMIEGNYIGVDGTGATALAGQKEEIGIQVNPEGNGNPGSFVNTSIVGNVISGWGLAGVQASVPITIEGNLIGTDSTGLHQVPNGTGISSTRDDQIGGTMSGQGNIIAYNMGPGIVVGGTGNRIEGNAIYGNGGLGIDLGGSGVPILNDSLGHAGPNNYQDFPVLTSAMVSGSNVTVRGTLPTNAGTAPFTVDVYASPTADPSYYGQGQYDLGAFSIPPVSNPFINYSFSTASLPAALLAAPWYISTTATDANGNTSEFSKDVCIPVTGVTGPSDGVPGQPRTFTLSANASAVDQPAGFTFFVNWGDGTTQTVQGLSGVKVDHVYTGTGTLTMSVTATDLDGGTSSAVSQAISVQQVVMEGNSLAVGGTLGNDTITLTPADTTGDIAVNLNGTTSFNGVTTFTPTDHILVYGQSGNDTIQLASNKIAGTTYYITVPAFIYGGGTGHEIFSVAGSTANNVVIGGGGTNQITGGLGRDLLIAGLGASKLYAGSAGAILIGGWTDYDLTSTAMTYDQKLAALEAVMAEWGSADSYTTRVNDLTNGGGLNGSYLLNTSTVHDNGQTDTLFGFPAAAPLDWFFAGASDIIKHKNSGEVTTTIQ
jgi:hypothetical protein